MGAKIIANDFPRARIVTNCPGSGDILELTY